MQTENSKNYWLVGAAFGGQFEPGDLDWFLETGVWYCHDPKEDAPDKKIGWQVQDMRNLFTQIKKGDRIAIKKMDINAKEADILAIGIVKADADFYDKEIMKSAWRVYVDWLPVGENGSKKIIGRRVALNGLTWAIHKFVKDDDDNPSNNAWIREIFCI